MTQPVKLALALWVLAFAVFNVTFDRQTRVSGIAFIEAQRARHAQALPVATINDGFRPLVGAAAKRASLWLLLIIAGGAGAVALSAKHR
jgi:hypothetical protein